MEKWEEEKLGKGEELGFRGRVERGKLGGEGGRGGGGGGALGAAPGPGVAALVAPPGLLVYLVGILPHALAHARLHLA